MPHHDSDPSQLSYPVTLVLSLALQLMTRLSDAISKAKLAQEVAPSSEQYPRKLYPYIYPGNLFGFCFLWGIRYIFYFRFPSL
ncbi:hypothetical protein K505DRAFT_321111 [Melanomma pulvis-pyrius CBS 109.77]|uniref:Uncharacterized protein n=1 Tax=Melanomma pulvis-pyrius CBS 109.77 TaxID=1314802 RepID=A0A6A6XTF0_9PLEO|nr:hypothetical protein K505DRAFT_321111 [Melanomma pulvis-pyrius CBS 109.77]